MTRLAGGGFRRGGTRGKCDSGTRREGGRAGGMGGGGGLNGSEKGKGIGKRLERHWYIHCHLRTALFSRLDI